MLGRAHLIRGLATHGRDGTVISAMRRDFHSTTAMTAGVTIEGTGDGSRLVAGDPRWQARWLLTAENVMEFLMLKGALKSIERSRV